MKPLLFVVLILLASSLFAAPLESGYALAPRSSATPEERAQAYINARQRVIEASRRYEGVPYRYGGMTASGLDCSGFLCLTFQDALGVALPRSASALYSWVERTPLERAQPGDFLFFRTDNTGNITHVVLYLGDRRFIHSASAGPQTGVIYSSLNEQYWADAYAGAGRAFPEAAASFTIDNNPSVVNDSPISGGQGRGGVQSGASGKNDTRSSGGNIIIGVAFAPSWSGLINNGNVLRGVTTQLSIGTFGKKLGVALELRSEYDNILGVFRLPLTLSFGSDKLRVFAGPVLSFGGASLSTGESTRRYSGGTSWLGLIGINATPFIFRTAAGDFAPYAEAAWQSYFSDSDFNFAADLTASFRFSTGIRWTKRLR
jgi:probable lipoprotein NlpC